MIENNNILPEEIRIKKGQPIVIRSAGKEYTCSEMMISEREINHIMMNATNGAFHSIANHIQNGYLTLPDGCRLGICGEGIMQNNELSGIKNITSICIRIANQVIGCADQLLSSILAPKYQNTIIISPPGIGKTTLLRELIRVLSEKGYYMGVADERGELSGMSCGKSVFDLGNRTDVMFGIAKQSAASMIVRTMAPDILAMDEITSIRDMPAIVEAVGCGVGLLTTIHGTDVSDLMKPSFRPLYELNIFQLAIVIEIRDGCRTYRTEKLYD